MKLASSRLLDAATAFTFAALCACTANDSANAASWSFDNVTRASVDELGGADYRFDALWTDFNGDGCYDPFVYDHANHDTSRLWINRCDGSHSFELVGNAQVHYNIPQPQWPRGSGWLSLLDANGDGRQDFWTRDADSLAAVYLNGTEDGAHIPRFSAKQPACTDHCVFADIDGDQVLDIIHPDRSIESMDNRSQLFGAHGEQAEIVPMDVDGDGWTDLVQPQLHGYWHNAAGDLAWREAAIEGNPVQYAVADFDNDGDLDLFLYNEFERSSGSPKLYRNNGQGDFEDVTATSGLADLAYGSWWTGYGNSLAADFDNDGLQDLLVSAAGYSPSVVLMRNTGGMRFEASGVDLGTSGSGADAYKARGSVADFDNDGRLDVIKTQDETNVGIWRNTSAVGNQHWLKLRLRGSGANTNAVGADVRIFRAGSDTLLAHLTVRAGPQHHQTWLHTGVGTSPQVDVQVRFPAGGASYRFTGLEADQELIVFANGCLIEHWQPGNGWPLTPPVPCAAATDSSCTEQAQVVARTESATRAAAAGERSRQAASASGQPPAENTACVGS